MKSFLHILRSVAASAVLLTLAAGAAAQTRAATTPPTRQILVYPANHGAICRSDAGVNVVSSGSLRGYKQDSDEQITTGSLQTLSFSGLRIQKLQLYVLENGGELGAPIDSIWADAGRAAFRTDDAGRSTGVSNGGFFGPQRGSSAPIRYSFNAPADQTVIFGGRGERWGSPATSHVQVRNNTALASLSVDVVDALFDEYVGKRLVVRVTTAEDLDVSPTVDVGHIDFLFQLASCSHVCAEAACISGVSTKYSADIPATDFTSDVIHIVKNYRCALRGKSEPIPSFWRPSVPHSIQILQVAEAGRLELLDEINETKSSLGVSFGGLIAREGACRNSFLNYEFGAQEQYFGGVGKNAVGEASMLRNLSIRRAALEEFGNRQLLVRVLLSETYSGVPLEVLDVFCAPIDIVGASPCEEWESRGLVCQKLLSTL